MLILPFFLYKVGNASSSFSSNEINLPLSSTIPIISLFICSVFKRCIISADEILYFNANSSIFTIFFVLIYLIKEDNIFLSSLNEFSFSCKIPVSSKVNIFFQALYYASSFLTAFLEDNLLHFRFHFFE